MRNRSLPIFILYVFLVLPFAVFASTIDDINNNISKIREAAKADKLYSIRYSLDRINAQGNLSIEEKRQLLKAYALLTDAFSSWNHYRNAADVYMDYLQLHESYHADYMVFLKDSLENQNRIIAEQENNKIGGLDNTLKDLREQQAVVAGMKQKYLTYGGLAFVAIVSLFVILLIKRNKAIQESRKKLNSNQVQVKAQYRLAAESALTEGGIRFAAALSEEGMAFIDSMEDSKPEGVNWDKIRSALSKVLKP